MLKADIKILSRKLLNNLRKLQKARGVKKQKEILADMTQQIYDGWESIGEDLADLENLRVERQGKYLTG